MKYLPYSIAGGLLILLLLICWGEYEVLSSLHLSCHGYLAVNMADEDTSIHLSNAIPPSGYEDMAPPKKVVKK